MSPTPPVLPAGSELGHSYEYGLDVNIGTTEAPVWQPARRISNFNPTPTPKSQTAQSYDDFGADNADITGWNTNLAFAIQVNRNTGTGLYLPEIEALLERTRPSAKGSLAVVEVRWYHKPEAGAPNPNDAGQGYFTVGFTRANTGADGAVELLNFTLTGKGSAWEIVNPFTGWVSAAPTITTALPTGAATGDQVVLTGTGFQGTTAVTVGAAPADFIVISDSTLVIVMPAGVAGATTIVATNATGASVPFNYTRAA